MRQRASNRLETAFYVSSLSAFWPVAGRSRPNSTKLGFQGNVCVPRMGYSEVEVGCGIFHGYVSAGAMFLSSPGKRMGGSLCSLRLLLAHTHPPQGECAKQKRTHGQRVWCKCAPE